MDSFLMLLFDLLLGSACSPETPKIDVRLLYCFPNQDNELNIEIENISNNLIELESVTKVLKNSRTRKRIYQILNFTEYQLILSLFSPQKMNLIVLAEKNIESVKYFKFKLIKNRKKILKVTPTRLFKRHC
jgi:hypothetical protein